MSIKNEEEAKKEEVIDCIDLVSDDEENIDPNPPVPIKRATPPAPPQRKPSSTRRLHVTSQYVTLVPKVKKVKPTAALDYSSSEDEEEIAQKACYRNIAMPGLSEHDLTDVACEVTMVLSDSDVGEFVEARPELDGKPSIQEENSVEELLKGIRALSEDRRLGLVYGKKDELASFVKNAKMIQKMPMLLSTGQIRDLFAMEIRNLKLESTPRGDISLSKVYRALKRSIKEMGPVLQGELRRVLETQLGDEKVKSRMISIGGLGKFLDRLVENLVFIGGDQYLSNICRNTLTYYFDN